jgi:hypothetical protein
MIFRMRERRPSDRRKMICRSLLWGVFITLLVACLDYGSVWLRWQSIVEERMRPQGILVSERYRPPPALFRAGSWHAFDLFTAHDRDWAYWAEGTEQYQSSYYFAYGFPFRSNTIMFAEGYRKSTGSSAITANPYFDSTPDPVWYHSGIRWPGELNKPRIPVMVLPLGMAANAMIYAALFATGSLAWSKLSIARRGRRGLCTRCKYALADLDKCPECGTEV